jgi:hypothetical protein
VPKAETTKDSLETNTGKRVIDQIHRRHKQKADDYPKNKPLES